MPDLLAKCNVCGALLDEEDLFCANCGTEAPLAETKQAQPIPTQTLTRNFICQGCGASMAYDAAVGALRCPFCGSTRVDEQPPAQLVTPSRIVPFAVSREQAVASMRAWLSKGFWRPNDLSEQAAVVKMTPVFVPYWVFQAQTFTYWTADTSAVPLGSNASWAPLSGEHRGEYNGLLVSASGPLSSEETAAIAPFDMALALPAEQVDLSQTIHERFSVPRKSARPLARQGLESLEMQASAKHVPGNCRHLKVNTRIEDLTSEPMLLPVWIMAYRYQNRVYRFLANGQTGQATGQAPESWIKKLVVFGLIALAVLILFMLFTKRARGVEPTLPNFSSSNPTVKDFCSGAAELGSTTKCAANPVFTQ